MKIEVITRAFCSITGKIFELPEGLGKCKRFAQAKRRCKRFFESKGFLFSDTFHHDVFVAEKQHERIVVCFYSAERYDWRDKCFAASGCILLSDLERLLVEVATDSWARLNNISVPLIDSREMASGLVSADSKRVASYAIASIQLSRPCLKELAENLLFALRNPKKCAESNQRLDVAAIREETALTDYVNKLVDTDLRILGALKAARDLSCEYPIAELESAIRAFVDCHQQQSIPVLNGDQYTADRQIDLLRRTVAALSKRATNLCDRECVADCWEMWDMSGEDLDLEVIRLLELSLRNREADRKLIAELRQFRLELRHWWRELTFSNSRRTRRHEQR